MDKDQLKILVVDDNEDDVFLVKELLREEFSDSIVALVLIPQVSSTRRYRRTIGW